MDTGDAKSEKDFLRDVSASTNINSENYPDGIYVYWQDGFYVAVNYSSESYTMQLSGNARILIGEAELKPAAVLVWSE